MGNGGLMEMMKLWKFFDEEISFDILFEEISGHDFWMEEGILASGDIAH